VTAATIVTAPAREPAAIRTTVGKKVLVAISGLLFIGFVIAHMIGNLKIFLGSGPINRYGEWLRDMGEPAFPRSVILWTLRTVLFVGLIVHVGLTVHLARRSRAARQNRYVHPGVVDANYASRTMRWGGVILLFFIIYHIMNLTLGVVGYAPGGYQPEDAAGFHAYTNVINAFSNPFATTFYVIAMLALGMHLYHGFWSMFQTLGLNSYRTDRILRVGAGVVAAVLTLGFIAVPLAVLFGIVS